MDYLEFVALRHSEFAHHGIQGQKWGEKNGPPYPLNRSDYSSAEKRKNPVGNSGSEKENAISRIKNRVSEANKARVARKAEEDTRKKEEAKRKAEEDARKRTEEAAAERQKDINSGDPDKVYKHLNSLTKSEFDQAMSRIDMKVRLDDAKAKQISKADEINNTVQKIVKYGKTVADVKDVMNRLSGESQTTIAKRQAELLKAQSEARNQKAIADIKSIEAERAKQKWEDDKKKRLESEQKKSSKGSEKEYKKNYKNLKRKGFI